jgi:hypothetical protein
MNLSRVLPVFSIAFCILYVVAMYFNLALVTYIPKARAFYALAYAPPANIAPGIYWYGWLLTSTIGAAFVAAAASLAPPRLLARLPAALIWIVPLGLFFVVVYILRDWFTH